MTRRVQGPLAKPRKPQLKAPPKSCDCHCHVFGPSDRFPYAADREYTPDDAPLADYLSILDVLGIERTVIVQPSIFGNDNSCTEDAVARLQGRALAVATVSPDITRQELSRLDRAGFRGVRFNLIHSGGSLSLDALEKMADKVSEFAWHIQLYLYGSSLPDVEERLRRLPCPIVIDHMGQMEPEAGLKQSGVMSLMRLLDEGRCWVKLCPYRYDFSGFPFKLAGELARAFAAARPDRMLWGTDWPHPDISGGEMPDDGDLLDSLAAWFNDEALIERILVANPEMLYGFETRPPGS